MGACPTKPQLWSSTEITVSDERYCGIGRTATVSESRSYFVRIFRNSAIAAHRIAKPTINFPSRNPPEISSKPPINRQMIPANGNGGDAGFEVATRQFSVGIFST